MKEIKDEVYRTKVLGWMMQACVGFGATFSAFS